MTQDSHSVSGGAKDEWTKFDQTLAEPELASLTFLPTTSRIWSTKRWPPCADPSARHPAQNAMTADAADPDQPVNDHAHIMTSRAIDIGTAVAPVSFSSDRVPALVAAAGEQAGVRFLEFFAFAIRNPHTRRAYSRTVAHFLAWCADREVTSLQAVRPSVRDTASRSLIVA